MTVSRRKKLLATFGATTLSAAVLLSGGAVSAAWATPGGSVAMDQGPSFPSADEITAAKGDEAAKKKLVEQLEGTIATLSDQQDSAISRSLEANNAYGTALETLKAKQDAAATAQARLTAAQSNEKGSRHSLGTLASSLYKNGGVSPAMESVLSGNAKDVLNKVTTLDTIAQKENANLDQALAARQISASLSEEARNAQKAADEAAKAADESHTQAQSAQDAVTRTLQAASTDRARAVANLAAVRGTTIALETARVKGLEEQRQAQRMRELQERAAELLAQQPAPAPQQGSGSDAPAAAPGGQSGGQMPNFPSTPVAPSQPSAVTPTTPRPPAVTPPPVQVPRPPAANPAPAPVQPSRPPVVTPPRPPVVTPPPVQPPAPAKPPVVTPPPSSGNGGQTAINFAMSKVGGPYVWGGNGPVGYDCSGLVSAAYASAGVGMPRTATAQFFAAPQRVPMNAWQPGDLIFFGDGSYFYHVAIYLGGGKVVQALNPSSGITVTPLSWMSGMQLWPVAGRY